MKLRAIAVLGAVTMTACSGERLTGTAAQDAARQYQAQASTVTRAPLFFLDGREIPAEQARSMDTKAINSIEVVKGLAAVRLYGERARDGVVFITSKPGSGTGAR